MKKSISVVIPLYNEEDNIIPLYRELISNLPDSYKYEILFVDDGSRDSSLRIVKSIESLDPYVKSISMDYNQGHEVANYIGIKNATGDGIVLIDCDLQDPPEIIPQFIKYWEDGWKVVTGRRRDRKYESIFKRVLTSIFFSILNIFASVYIDKNVGDFRLIDKDVKDAYLKLKKKLFYRYDIASLGYETMDVQFSRGERFSGKSNYSYIKLVRLGFRYLKDILLNRSYG